MRLVLDNDVLCRGDVDGAGWRHLESRGRPHADSPIAELRGATLSLERRSQNLQFAQ